MEKRWILPVPEYYARLNAYIREVGLPYSLEDCMNWAEEVTALREIMGEGNGRAVLDCSCGWGRQSIALGKLGWQVTACDFSETSLEFARGCARQEGLAIDFQVCDMRDLPARFERKFDWVVSCFALYEIPEMEGIRQAIRGMYAALKPGGRCYLVVRDMDFLMEEQPRHEFHGEKRVEHGRVICIEDWDLESDSQVVALHAFLREDERHDPSDYLRWQTETIGCRKHVLRKAELAGLLREAGFDPVTFLEQPEPWFPARLTTVRATDRTTDS